MLVVYSEYMFGLFRCVGRGLAAEHVCVDFPEGVLPSLPRCTLKVRVRVAELVLFILVDHVSTKV